MSKENLFSLHAALCAISVFASLEKKDDSYNSEALLPTSG